MRPGWKPDPAKRFSLRYHDGTRWTDQVSDGTGEPLVDPDGGYTWMPPPPRARTAQEIRQRKWVTVVLVVGGILVVGGLIVAGLLNRNSQSPTDGGAFDVCQGSVSQKIANDKYSVGVYYGAAPDRTSHKGDDYQVDGHAVFTGRDYAYKCNATWLGDGKWDVMSDVTPG